MAKDYEDAILGLSVFGVIQGDKLYRHGQQSSVVLDRRGRECDGRLGGYPR